MRSFVRRVIYTGESFSPITDFGSRPKSVKRDRWLFPLHSPEGGVFLDVGLLIPKDDFDKAE